MNDVYFACIPCKTLVDAGYRWAYWTLEHSKIVTRGAVVAPASILNHAEYWEPSEPAAWLHTEIFPRVRTFFHDHAAHELRYGEEQDFVADDLSYLAWLELGPTPNYTPRYFREVMGLRTWALVESWVASHAEEAPYWWHDAAVRDAARIFFGTLYRD